MLCAAAAATTIVACAMGGAKPSTAPPPTAVAAPATPELVQPNSPQDDQIAELSRSIETDRTMLHLPPPPPGTGRTAAAPMSSDIKPSVAPVEPTTQATCHPASDTCTQSCTLSDSICDNAKKICDLAKDLPGDSWADDKCRTATQTCSSAHDKCCGCS